MFTNTVEDNPVIPATTCQWVIRNKNFKKTTLKTFQRRRKKRKKNEAEQNDPWNRPGCPTLRVHLVQCTSRSAIIQKRATKKCPFRVGIKKEKRTTKWNGKMPFSKGGEGGRGVADCL
ncbi:hypothetical protein TNCT_375551 [Trichonephila clavata]|uniref:Uncharacterized protein n=1 Tax=Trichonephila clavata TaxID=2740835 RepID=A0A8X6KSJ7_TRICU|nr:hypothetical protein TNCT_375551 [Trichonephila clavata]